MTPPRKRAAHLGVPSEESEQIKLAQWLDLAKVLWCHVPNGGGRSKREAARLKAAGVKAGVPDVLIFSQPPNYWDCFRPLDDMDERLLAAFTPDQPSYIGGQRISGVAIELKKPGSTWSAVSTVQRIWATNLTGEGWYWFAARGADEAIAELQRIGYRGPK